jgi:catechol 2,3-dioxygenase-like lactoylglutathione lyase family enzyme
MSAVGAVTPGESKMELAKPQVDIGLSTNHLDPMLAFWQQEVGLRFDHALPVRRGQTQYRHDALGSVVKINHHVHPLPATPPSGYRELMISRELQPGPESMIDPDGNRVCIVPKGYQGIDQIGIRLTVRDLASHRRFYTDALGLREEARSQGAAFRAGETLIILEEQTGLPVGDGARGSGWGYITFQVYRVDEVHASVLKAGGQEALAPTTLGTTARISMVLDPDKNWIELSQRASIVGTLAPS